MLAVDYGERRVGLALSDPTGTLATPLPTLTRRRGKRAPVTALARLAEEHAVEEVVVGLPLTAEGEDDDWTREVRAFGRKLGQRIGRPVRFLDERFTSALAERAVRASGLPKRERERKERVDAASAVLILQAYLDRRRSGQLEQG